MAQTSSSDSLVRLARCGDQTAFRALYERSVHDLKARIRRRIGPALRRKVDASDILQDAYVVALRRLDEFTGESTDAFDAWLATIVEFRVKETIRHYVRSEKRALDREVTQARIPDPHGFRSQVSSPSQRAIAGELDEAVATAMERLRPDYREIILLIQKHHVSLDEAARRMERSRTAAQKLYERALASLAKELNL